MILVALAAASFIATLHAQEGPGPSVLEMALSERTCDVAARAAPGGDRSACIEAQLAALRADFGVNLGKLSPADRRKLDAACSGLSTTLARERYLDCVNAQLSSVRERTRRAKGVDAAAAPAPAESNAATVPVAPPPARVSTTTLLALGTVAVVAIAAAIVVVTKKRAGPKPVCKSCGAPVADHGALCAVCRHQAAESLRQQAAAARATEETEAENRRRAAEEAAQREAQRAEAAAHAAAAALDLQMREQAEAVRRERSTREAADRAPVPSNDDEAFNPYGVLGVAEGATPDAIRAAYEAAKAKYDPDNVSHLSPEVQQHYREKADLVEQAFRALMGV